MTTVRAPERTSDQPCVDCLDQSLSAGHTRPAVPVIGVGVASEFIGDFRAVLALSILLAGVCLFSLTRIRNTR